MSRGELGRVYADGDYVVRQGDKGECMYVVQSGMLEVTREQDGAKVPIGIMKSGEIFGEMSIFEREVRSASVRALGEARVLTVDKRTFLGRIQEDPALAFNLVKIMSRRLRHLTAEIAKERSGTSTGTLRSEARERLGQDDRRSGRDRRSGLERRAPSGTARGS